MTALIRPRFGSSSWAYEGWQGLVYQRTYPKSRFSADTYGRRDTLIENLRKCSGLKVSSTFSEFAWRDVR
jgi:hypothetical protein